MIEDVLRSLLVADSDVTDDLATYQFASGAAEVAAVFTSPKLPDDVEHPCIFISAASAAQWGCRTARGSLLTVDVTVFDNRLQNSTRLDRIAWNVWEALDRADLNTLLDAEGYADWGCQAQAPRSGAGAAGAKDAFPSRIIVATCRVLKKETLQ